MAEVEARWSLTWGFLWFYEYQLQISMLRKAVALSPCQCSVEGKDLCGCWVWDSMRKQSTESSSGGFYKCRCWGFYLFAFLFLPQRKHFLLIFLPSNDAFLCVLCEVANGSEVVFFFCLGSGFHTPSLSKSRPAVCPLCIWFIWVPPGMCLYNLLIPGTWVTLA